MKKNRLVLIAKEIITASALISMLFQSVLPFTYALPAYAQEVTPTDTATPTPTDTPVVTPTDTPTQTPTDTITPTPTDTATVTPTAGVTVTPTDTTTVTPTDTATDTPTPDVQNPTNPPSSANTNSQGPPSNNNSSTVTPTPQAPTPTVTPVPATDDNGVVSSTIVKNVSAPSLDLGAPTSNGSATITTNKSDYSPTDTAVISGSGFLPNKAYTLEITSSDAPAVDFTTVIQMNDQGAFVYAYQLDGNYRPNYTVYVKNGDNTVATTTFTDSTVPSNKVGISMYGFVLSGSYSLVSNQPTGTGQIKNGNVGAYPEGSCIPVEVEVTNNDNSAGDIIISPVYDYFNTVIGIDHLEQLTTSLSGNPRSSATNLNNFSYSTSDLTSVISFKNSNGTTTNAVISGPYSGNNAGSSSTTSTDAQRHYNATLSNVPVGATVYMVFCGRLGVDASQYNGGSSLSIRSAQGGNENVPIPVNQILQLPSLTLTKVVSSGTATPDQFSFNVSPAINGVSHYTITSGQNSVTIQNISPDGNYTITESGPAGYTFSSGSGTNCTFSGSTATATVAAGKPATNASCTFTNALSTATLQLIKNTIGGDGTFSFTASPSVTLSNITTVSGTGSTSATITPNTQYTVTETPVSGWTTSYSNCTNISASAGQTVTCTITNTKQATLTVNKVCSPTTDSGLFNLKIDSTVEKANAACGSTTGAVVVSTGAHIVSETAGTSTDLSNYTATYSGNCDAKGNITISAGQNATCTITNTRSTGSIHVNKALDTTGSGTYTVDNTSANSLGFTWSLDGSGTNAMGATVSGLNTGNHTVAENTATNYHFVGWYNNSGTGSCTTPDGTSTATVPVSTNATTTITLCNQRDTGSVVVHKALDTTGSGTFTTDDTEAGILGFTWTLSGYPAKSFGTTMNSVPTGSYTVTENINSQPYTFVGWYTTGSNTYSCTNPQGLTFPITVGVAYVSTTDITLCNQRQTGTITLNKQWSGTPGQTTLQIGTSAGAHDVAQVQTGTNGTIPLTTGTKTLNTGTYYVSETGGLTNYSSSLSCSDQNGSVTVGSNNSIALTSGEAVVCTFTNTRNTGFLTITKTAYGIDGNQAFDFSVSGASASSQTITPTGSNGTYTGSTQNITVDTGTYSVTETNIPSGWTQIGVGCTDMTTNTPLSSNINFTVTSGHTVNCTFYNTEYSSISGLKFNDANGDGSQNNGEVGIQGWKIDLTGTTFDSPGYTGTTVNETATTSANGGFSFTNLLPGSYTICEETLTNWSQTYPDNAHSTASCANGTNGYAVLIDSTEAGTTFSGNTFGNQGYGTLKIVKTTVGGNGTFDYTVTGTTGSSQAITTNNNSGSVGPLSVAAGTYSVSETTQTGWNLDTNNTYCSDGKTIYSTSTITIAAGSAITCYFTNDKLPTLKIIKTVINDNGGTASASAFNLYVKDSTNTNVAGSPAAGSATGTTYILNSGTYTVSEDDPSSLGYAQTGIVCDGQNSSSVTLRYGDTKTCTITNDDKVPSLTLTKKVSNTHGGTASATDFTLTATGPTTISGAGGATSDSSFSAGTYTLSESSLTGYQAGSWSCTGDVTNSGTSITLGLGQSASCEITNSDIAPTLKLVKYVTNNNGGTNVAGDWTLSATGNGGFSYAGNTNTFQSVLANTAYTLSESGPVGYTAGSWSCDGGSLKGDQLTLGLAQNVTCSITNDDIAPSLTLVKLVDNQNVGTASATDFTLTATGPTTISGAGGATSDSSFSAGTYTLSETNLAGYTASSWGCLGGSQNGNQITLGLGDSAVCTITNTRDTGTIIVHKQVDTTGTGVFSGDDTTANTLGFTWSLDGSGTNAFGASQSGVTTLDTHQINENINYFYGVYHFVGWYDNSEDGSCAKPDGTTLPIDVSLLHNGDNKTITLCNARDTGTLRVEKVVEDPNGNVVNNDPTLFTFTVSQNNVSEGQAQIAGGQYHDFVLPTDVYDVTETTQAGYKFLGCQPASDEDEYDTLPNGISIGLFTDTTTTVICTNQQQLPIITITKFNNTEGANKGPGDLVLYTITVTATQSAANNVTVTDLLPKGFTYQSGSWTANVTAGPDPEPCPSGDLKACGITTEPTYHSPGTWQLGSMSIGETITLTLLATVTDIDPGDYKDVTWAQGISGNGTTVLALAQPTGYVDTNFVGTDVNVVNNKPTTSYNATQSLIQSVLGAELPATGANIIWIDMAISLLILGFASVMIAKIIRRKYHA